MGREQVVAAQLVVLVGRLGGGAGAPARATTGLKATDQISHCTDRRREKKTYTTDNRTPLTSRDTINPELGRRQAKSTRAETAVQAEITTGKTKFICVCDVTS